MLPRRSLRIKVMQVLYSQFLGNESNAVRLEKSLNAHIQKSENMYYIFMMYMVEICQYAIVDAAKRAAKHVPTEEDKNVNTDIASNQIIQLIKSDEKYNIELSDRNLHGFIDKKLVRDLYKKLTATEKYQQYIAKEKSRANEADIIRYILKKIIGSSELLEENLSEHFINLEDDHFICIHSLQKKVKEYGDSGDEKHFLASSLLKMDKSEDIAFAKELLAKCLQYDEELDSTIAPRLKNWDKDRVATLDMILLTMAICEFMYFPFIPTKVTINEYIDISKEYSTQKSKDFINGILDKTMRDLKEKGEIKKQGRGLINN
ncbi:MAG: transcription antitermination factor NusB [Chitinophagales bacterium]